MRVTPPVDITTLKLTSSAAAEPHDPAAYSAGTTYAFGAIVKVAADFKIYESILPANTGNTPSINPIWWRALGPTEAAYNAATTYALGDTVSSSVSHRIYESLSAGNVGNPLPVLPETATAKWLDVGPTNRFAMFDLSRNSQTVCPSPLTIVIAPGERINTLGLAGLSASEVQISATSVMGGGTVYPNAYSESATGIFDLKTRIVNDGYDYAFEPFTTLPSMAIFDLPAFSDIIITVTITAGSGNVKCGALVVGTYIYIGDIQYGVTNDGMNFSTVTRDVWGNATLVPRRTIPKTSQTLTISADRINRCKEARVLLNALPALWTGIDDNTSSWFDMLTILGIYTQFQIGAVNNSQAEINLSLEEI